MRDWLKPVGATLVLLVLIFSIIASSPYILYAKEEQVNALVPPSASSVDLIANYNQPTTALIEEIRNAPKVNSTPTLGMYSQANALPSSTQPYIQHSFVDWRDSHYFAFVLAKSLQSCNTPLVTIEPRGDSDGSQLLADIARYQIEDALR